MTTISRTVFLLLVFAAAVAVQADATFDVRYVARITELPAGSAGVQVWVPLPVSNTRQIVSDLTLHSDIDWTVITEPEFGNTYAYARVYGRREVALEVNFQLARRSFAFGRWTREQVTPEEKQRALTANRLVTISPRVREIALRVTAAEDEPLEKARAIYRYVLGTMRYDKETPGWGQGDTERACDLGRGNCTDFHSLFLSLARAAGIPARFVMGVPLTSAGGTVGSYHCWAEFHVEGQGWIPVDVSEASKLTDVERRQFFFGNLDAERVELTVGRDIRLPFAEGAPLNYSFHPYAETAGASVGCPAVEVMYRRRDQEHLAVRR